MTDIDRPQVVRRDNVVADTLPDSLHPILRRVLAARGIVCETDLDLSLQRLLPFHALAGIERACELLEQALIADSRLLIIGDFDADGATASALGMRGLRMLGATNVDYLVPNRFEYGYGLTPEIVELALGRRPDVIITVDNGISSNDGVRAAQAAGIKVVITDHHLPGAVLPDADAIVNPNQHGDRFASKALAGVGVMFYVLLALRARLREHGWFAARGLADPNLAALLDLVALGTIADVVPMDSNNRILAAQGLKRIRAGQCCPGILALLHAAGRDYTHVRATDLGFAVGPRLNAAGRLADMTIGIELLLADDPLQCRAMAATLDELNTERRSIEREMRSSATTILDRLGVNGSTAGDRAALCLYDEAWHQGVIGILASRIKDQCHRPVVAFAPGGDGEIKGSARSIPGLHIRDALDTIAARHPGLLRRFGGHAMAAGLTLRHADLDRFAAVLDATVRERIDPHSLRREILSDGELAAADFSLSLARELQAAMPWGQDCPEPVFDGEFAVFDQRIVGKSHLKFRLTNAARPAGVDAILFNAGEALRGTSPTRVRAAFRLDINDYRGIESLQLILEHIEPF